jgi:hypothetical protein
MIRLRIVVFRSFEMFPIERNRMLFSIRHLGSCESKITKTIKGKKMHSAHSKTEKYNLT